MKLLALIFLFCNLIYPFDDRILTKINKLKNLVETSNGLKKLEYYVDLLEYLVKTKPNKALLEKDIILSLSDSLKEQLFKPKIYLSIGKIYDIYNTYDTELINYRKGLQIAEYIRDSLSIANFWVQIGKIHTSIGEFDTALTYFDKALEIADRNNYNKVKALSFNYLGIINYFTNNLTEAEELTLKGLALSEKENFYKGKSLANEHLCIIKIKQKKFQEALNYNNNSYKISLENDDIVNIPAVFYNFSIIYNLLGEYDKAIDYSFKALDIEKSFNNSKGQANEFIMIGRILQNKGDFDGSKKYLHKAYEIYKELKSLRHLIFVLRALSSAYEITGNYKLALLYFKELTTYNDSMFNEKVKREVALSNTKRSLKEKEEKIALLEKTNELNKSVQRYLTFIIFFTLFSFFIISILYLKILKSREETLKINENLVKLNNERQKFF